MPYLFLVVLLIMIYYYQDHFIILLYNRMFCPTLRYIKYEALIKTQAVGKTIELVSAGIWTQDHLDEWKHYRPLNPSKRFHLFYFKLGEELEEPLERPLLPIDPEEVNLFWFRWRNKKRILDL